MSTCPPGSDPAETPALKPAALVLTSAPSDTFHATAERVGCADPRALSPIHQLDVRMPPLIEFHGVEDKVIPVAVAVALRERLLATGNVAELVAIPGGGHNFVADVPAWKEKTLQMIRDFLERQRVLPADGTRTR